MARLCSCAPTTIMEGEGSRNAGTLKTRQPISQTRSRPMKASAGEKRLISALTRRQRLGPLRASGCMAGEEAGADVIAPNGKPFSEESIGMTLAVRNLMTDLRSTGEVTGGPKSFSPRDRSAFLSSLDQTIRRIQRAQQK